MTEKIRNFMGLTVLENDTEGGLYFNAELQEKLASAIDAAQASSQALAEAQGKVAELTAQVEQLTSAQDGAVADAVAKVTSEAESAAASHAEEISNLIASHEAAIAALTTERDNAQAELHAAQESLNTANARIAELEALAPAEPKPTPAAPATEGQSKAWKNMTLAEKKAAWSK